LIKLYEVLSSSSSVDKIKLPKIVKNDGKMTENDEKMTRNDEKMTNVEGGEDEYLNCDMRALVLVLHTQVYVIFFLVMNILF
jgi:hypothetical protein